MLVNLVQNVASAWDMNRITGGHSSFEIKVSSGIINSDDCLNLKVLLVTSFV
ncbi:hypothetical protein TcasGA2_TC033059 [Tribolium castaneum]|uniref:Uncharacterized protein n=1 Tax=Tribolium castaneum TaxID=7070 RepID=A0A139WID4_TRICA|nr:hypothetical protein TcasGA2_TC033059 [Tribolium castaneum]